MKNCKDSILDQLHKLKMRIYYKKNHSDIFEAFQELEHQINQMWKEKEYQDQSLKQKNSSYSAQIDEITKHMSNREQFLENENKSLREQLSRLEQENLNASLSSL